jgi:hypothetical protein
MQTITKHLYCDVAIIGGGVGGCSAAITASRRGLHTILLDKAVSLGGLATNGYVPGVAGMIEGNCKELVKRLQSDGWIFQRGPEDDHNVSFDPEFTKFMLETMVMENGGRIIYDATCMDADMDEKNIRSAIFYTKGGPMAVHASYFIDATGDADVAMMAGAPYQVGGADFAGLNMSTTLGTRWQGYNRKKYETANKEWQDKQREIGIDPQKCVPLLYSLEEQAIEVGELVRHVGNRYTGIFMVQIPNTKEEDLGFCTYSFHSYFTHNTDVEDITRQVIEQHQLIQQYEKFLRKFVPGYENIHLIGLGSLPGVRDSRRIFGEYMLKGSDIASGAKFEDGIARFPEMLDTHHPTNGDIIFQRHIHMPGPSGTAVCRDPSCTAAMHPFGRPAGIEARPSPRDYCEIPYRCLIPKGVDNMLVVGRCCSAEFHANGAMRIIGPSMGTGQAAGIAVNLANSAGISPREIDGKEVRRILIEEEGVTLNKFPEGWWSKLRDQEGNYEVSWGDFIKIV